MNKINFFILIFGLICFKSIAQYEYKLDTVLKTGDTLIRYNLVNNIEIKCLSVKEKPYMEKERDKIYINNKLINIDARLYYLPLIFDNYIFINLTFVQGTSYKSKIYFLKNEKLEFYFDANEINYDNGNKQVYKIKDDCKIYLYDPIKKVEKLYCDLSNVIEKWDFSETGEKYPLEFITEIYFINPQKAFVELCYSDISPECERRRYFLVNKYGEKREITSKIEMKDYQKIQVGNVISNILFVSAGYIRESLFFHIKEGKNKRESIYKNRLFDDNFNLISEVLYFEPRIIGLNAKNGIIQYYYLVSRTNDNIEVFIPYKFIPMLDLAMYKAYNNNLLTEEDLKELGKYELGILRNLIFAKYNYDFSSEFYQAYFNLYDFYYKMRASRTKDIHDKLTETDRKNIEFIRNKEKSLGFIEK